MEKRVEHTFLIDIYGPLLTSKRLEALKLYYEEDLTYQEIAERMGISRQAVHGAIKSALTRLEEYESILGLARNYSEIAREAALCRKLLNDIKITEQRSILEAAMEALDKIELIAR